MSAIGNERRRQARRRNKSIVQGLWQVAPWMVRAERAMRRRRALFLNSPPLRQLVDEMTERHMVLMEELSLALLAELLRDAMPGEASEVEQ